MRTISIPCRFAAELGSCALTCGEIQVAAGDTRTISDFPEIVDNRCTYHEGTYGSFKDLVDRFIRETGLTYADFIAADATHQRKSAAVDTYIAGLLD